MFLPIWIIFTSSLYTFPTFLEILPDICLSLTWFKYLLHFLYLSSIFQSHQCYFSLLTFFILYFSLLILFIIVLSFSLSMFRWILRLLLHDFLTPKPPLQTSPLKQTVHPTTSVSQQTTLSSLSPFFEHTLNIKLI